MNDIEVLCSIKAEVKRDPFANQYTISGSNLRKLLRISDQAHAQYIVLQSFKHKNKVLRSRLSKMNDLKIENQMLKMQLQALERMSL